MQRQTGTLFHMQCLTLSFLTTLPNPKQVSDGGVASVLQLLHLFLEQPRWEETAMERSKQQVGGELGALRWAKRGYGLACAPAQACSQRQGRAGALVCPALPMITRPAAWLALSFLTVALFSHPCSPGVQYLSHYRSLSKSLERATADRILNAMLGPDRRFRWGTRCAAAAAGWLWPGLRQASLLGRARAIGAVVRRHTGCSQGGQHALVPGTCPA